MKILSSVSLASLALVAAACGGGKDDPPVKLIDAPQQQIDAPAVQCTAPASTATLLNPFLSHNPDRDDETVEAERTWRYIGDLNEDALPDWFWLELYEGPPPGFTTPKFPATTPFTVQLAGGELSYGTCSTCVSLTTDVDVEASQTELVYVDDYFATGGSVTFTTLTATNIAGTLNNVTFAHVDFDDMGTPVPNASGCTSTIATASFDGMVMANARDGRKGFAVRARIKK